MRILAIIVRVGVRTAGKYSPFANWAESIISQEPFVDAFNMVYLYSSKKTEKNRLKKDIEIFLHMI
jgi:hypothetical protein